MSTLRLTVDVESMEDPDLAAMLAALLHEAVARLGIPDSAEDIDAALTEHLTPESALTRLVLSLDMKLLDRLSAFFTMAYTNDLPEPQP